MTQTEIKLDYDSYPDGFWHWLGKNEHIYAAFKVKALTMALKGRKRYSARTIIETVRWESDLEDSEVTFKLNDKWTPGMARLFMSEFGERYPKFFEIRG